MSWLARDNKAEAERLEKEVSDLTGRKRYLEEQLQTAKRSLEDQKYEAQREKEDLQHLIAMKEDRVDITAEQKQLAKDKTHAEEMAAVKEEANTAHTVLLKEQMTMIQGMYDKLFERLPNVKVKLSGGVDSI